MNAPTRKHYDRIGWRWTCECGELLRSTDNRNGWGSYRCGAGHKWWHQYAKWHYRGSIHDEEQDPVLVQEQQQDEWLEQERRELWDL